MTTVEDRVHHVIGDVFFSVPEEEPEDPLFSVVIPMFNEERSIGSVLNRMPILPNCEIIVVDDGSSDSSRDVVRQFDNVMLVSNPCNMGYGKALMNGISHARGKIIVHLDSDGQHEPGDIMNMIQPIIDNDADIAIGSRYLGNYSYRLPASSRMGEALIELLLRSFFKIPVQANQGGFRAFRRDVLHDVMKDIKYSGFTFATETLIKASLQHYTIREVPIQVRNRQFGQSKIKLVRLFLSLMQCTVYYSLQRSLGLPWIERFSRFVRRIKLKNLFRLVNRAISG